MSIHEYEVGRMIAGQDYPFYALIQAAMRQADTDNLEKLRKAWPHIYEELKARYHAPNGILPSDGSVYGIT